MAKVHHVKFRQDEPSTTSSIEEMSSEECLKNLHSKDFEIISFISPSASTSQLSSDFFSRFLSTWVTETTLPKSCEEPMEHESDTLSDVDSADESDYFNKSNESVAMNSSEEKYIDERFRSVEKDISTKFDRIMDKLDHTQSYVERDLDNYRSQVEGYKRDQRLTWATVVTVAIGIVAAVIAMVGVQLGAVYYSAGRMDDLQSEIQSIHKQMNATSSIEVKVAPHPESPSP